MKRCLKKKSSGLTCQRMSGKQNAKEYKRFKQTIIEGLVRTYRRHLSRFLGKKNER